MVKISSLLLLVVCSILAGEDTAIRDTTEPKLIRAKIKAPDETQVFQDELKCLRQQLGMEKDKNKRIDLQQRMSICKKFLTI